MIRPLLLLFALLLLIGSPLRGHSAAPLDQLQVITPDNAADLQEIARYGSGNITSVAWASDVIAAGGALGVWLYDATALDAAPRLLPTTYLPYGSQVIALSADGRRVAAIDQTDLRVWDTASGAELAVFSAETPFYELSLSDDGSLVFGAYARDHRAIILSVWEVDTGARITEVESSDLYIARSRFEPNRRWLDLLDSHRLHRLNLQTGVLDTCCVDDAVYQSFTYDAEGQVVIARHDGIVRWNLNTQQRDDVIPYPGEPEYIYLCPDSSALAVLDLGADGIQAWRYDQPAAPTPLAALDRSRYFACAPGQPRIAGIFADDQLIVVDATTGSATTVRDEHTAIWTMALLSDNRALATSGAGGDITLWDLATGATRVFPTEYGIVPSLSIHPDGERLLYSGVNFATHRWDWGTGALNLLNLGSGAVRARHDGRSYGSVAFAPDGVTILTAAPESGQVIALPTTDFEENAGWVVAEMERPNTILYSPTGEHIFVSNGTNSRLINAQTGDPVSVNWLGMQNDAAFSPDGSQIAISYPLSDAGWAQLYLIDIANSDEPIYFDLERGNAFGLAFSPAGSLLATVVEGRLTVFEVSTQIRRFQADAAPKLHNLLAEITFSADGRLLVTATNDGLIRVWGVPEN